MLIAQNTALMINTRPRKAASHAAPKRLRGSRLAFMSTNLKGFFIPHLACPILTTVAIFAVKTKTRCVLLLPRPQTSLVVLRFLSRLLLAWP